MKVLIDIFAATPHAGFLAIAGHRSRVTSRQIVIAVHVAGIMMVVLVTGVHAFVVVVCTRFVDLISRVCTTFLVGVLGVLTMHVAGLKSLVLTRGGGPFLLRIS